MSIQRFGALQPQEVILGLFGEYVGPNDRAWSGGLVQVLVDLGFSVAASRVALNRVISRGLLAPHKEGRLVYYSITERMRIVQEEGRRQTYFQMVDPDWDERWTSVVYTLSDQGRAQRARLGRWLRFRGFGALQDGVWIGAGDHENDVWQLVKRLDMETQVVTFIGSLGGHMDLGETVRRAWKIDELKQLYQLFVEEFRKADKLVTSPRTEPRDLFVLRTRLIEMFRQTTSADPRLPDRKLLVKWNRREAIQLFHKLQDTLQPAANAYFRSLVLEAS